MNDEMRDYLARRREWMREMDERQRQIDGYFLIVLLLGGLLVTIIFTWR